MTLTSRAIVFVLTTIVGLVVFGGDRSEAYYRAV